MQHMLYMRATKCIYDILYTKNDYVILPIYWYRYIIWLYKYKTLLSQKEQYRNRTYCEVHYRVQCIDIRSGLKVHMIGNKWDILYGTVKSYWVSMCHLTSLVESRTMNIMDKSPNLAESQYSTVCTTDSGGVHHQDWLNMVHYKTRLAQYCQQV